MSLHEEAALLERPSWTVTILLVMVLLACLAGVTLGVTA